MKSEFLKLVIVFVSMLAPSLLAAQGIDAQLRIAAVKSDSNYIFGEGWGDTPADADKNALASLLSKIGTTVDSRFNLTEEEKVDDSGIDSKRDVKLVMNTYSQATLTNTETINLRQKNGEYYAFRYMLRLELEKIFNSRKDRVEDYVRTAMRSEEKGRVDDALRYLNWAYVLLHSLQNPADAKMQIEGDKQLLVNWIPNKIKEILEQVSVEVANVTDDNQVDVMFYYKGEPAAGVAYTYWDGKNNSPLNTAKDGMSHLSFPADQTVNDVLLVVETTFNESSQVDRELDMMMSSFKPLKFMEARKSIGVEDKALKADKGAKKDFQAQVTAGKSEGVTPLDKKEAKEYAAILTEVLKSVKSKSYKPNSEFFTEEGLEMFNRLLSYGNASILGEPDPGFYPFGKRVVARSVPMNFSFKNNRRNFVEDVTFTFSPDKKIESVAFGLGGAAREDVFSQGVGAWSDSVKMVIVTFLENYKTAFALKRLDYIRSIFDDNAYIIVGHKLQQMERRSNDGGGFSMVPKYEFVRKSKEEYMTQLEKCFKSNEFVNINFADNDVQKSAFGGDTFGIQIRQDYYSEHYGDQGYLFLFVDLNDADKPVIKIRTWQPERDPELTPNVAKNSRDFGIYSNSTFR
ncbi:MAG: hypothetical protein HDR88_06700 [Bacteroides sp.]|nr:hypothetical protein [Bacteroides sp.]